MQEKKHGADAFDDYLSLSFACTSIAEEMNIRANKVENNMKWQLWLRNTNMIQDTILEPPEGTPTLSVTPGGQAVRCARRPESKGAICCGQPDSIWHEWFCVV